MNGLAGTLKERVTIERRGAERDAAGGAAGSWRAIATVWAAVAPDGSAADGVGGAVSAMPRLRVTLRARPVSPAERLTWRGRRFAVREVIEDPRTPDRVVLRVEEIR